MIISLLLIIKSKGTLDSMDYLLFCCLLGLSAFFSGSETAFFNLTSIQLSQFKDHLLRRKRQISQLRSQPQELLITVLFGNELTNIALSIVSASIFSRLLPDASLAQQALYSSLFVVPILLTFGEITPKTLASFASERFATIVVYPLSGFAWLITPARRLLHWITDRLIPLFGKGDQTQDILDEQGFKALLDASAREGEVEEEEQTLIHNAFHFGDLTSKDVMRPWSQVICIDFDTPWSEMVDFVCTQTYSRLPVVLNQQVKGIIYTKDLLAYRWGLKAESTIQEIMHSILVAPDYLSLHQLLDHFKHNKKHLALIVDQHQNPIGICTMDDVLEEIFGHTQEEGIGSL